MYDLYTVYDLFDMYDVDQELKRVKMMLKEFNK